MWGLRVRGRNVDESITVFEMLTFSHLGSPGLSAHSSRSTTSMVRVSVMVGVLVQGAVTE